MIVIVIVIVIVHKRASETDMVRKDDEATSMADDRNGFFSLVVVDLDGAVFMKAAATVEYGAFFAVQDKGEGH